MLNQSKVTITPGVTRKTILVDEKNSTAVSCMVANTNVSDSEGRKIVKAGTPLAGDLTARNVAFTVASDATKIAGILLHDVDVTEGTANAQVVIFGTIDQSKLDSAVIAMLTTEIKAALKMVQFVA